MAETELYRDTPVMSEVWTLVPGTLFEVYQNMGRVCTVRYYFAQQTITFMDGGRWTVRRSRHNSFTSVGL